MKQHNHYSLILLLFMPAILGMLGSCSSDSGTDPAPPASSAGFSIATRAGVPGSDNSLYGDPDPTRPEELIGSWIAIFISIREGKVAEVVRSKTASSADPVEREYFMPENLTGTALYDIIAFANISEPDLSAAGIPLTEGAAADVAELAEKSWEIANNAFKPGEKAVPMSGIRRDVKITDNLEVSPGHAGRVCVIELIRMLAKVELKVRNSSESTLFLSGAGFGVLNKGAVTLFPDYDILNDGAEPEILQAITGSDGDTGNTETAAITLPASDREIAPGKVRSVVFYVRESSAVTTHPTRRFFITLSMADAGGEVRKEHYSPTDELQWINRNDHIVIPVSISDISVDWDVLFYPPIGGHPAVRTETDGDAYFMTFSTAGKFVIRPSVKNADGTPFPLRDFTFTVNTIVDADGNSIDLSSPAGTIFTKFPELSASGEIIGELNTSKGLAIMNCTLEFSYTKDNKTHTEKRTRNLYIIRD